MDTHLITKIIDGKATRLSAMLYGGYAVANVHAQTVCAPLRIVKCIFARRLHTPSMRIIPRMRGQQEAQRAYIRAAIKAAGCGTPTALARKSGLSPSTINRFLNSDDVAHLLDGKTLAKVAAASGLPVPSTVSESVAPVAVAAAMDALVAHGDIAPLDDKGALWMAFKMADLTKPRRLHLTLEDQFEAVWAVFSHITGRT